MRQASRAERLCRELGARGPVEAGTRRNLLVMDVDSNQRVLASAAIRYGALPIAGLIYAAIGLMSCASVQQLCFHLAFTANGRPEGGSARAGYCSVIAHWERWIVFPVFAVLIGTVAARLAGQRPRPYLWGVAATIAVAIAHFVIVGSQSAAYLAV